jgi:hypothetical protein
MSKGNLIKGSGVVLGSMFRINLLIAGAVISGIAILAEKRKMGRVIKTSSKTIGRFAGKAAKISAGVLVAVLEASKNEGFQLGKAVGKRVVQSKIRIYGDAKQFFDPDKIVEANFNQTK